MVSTPLFSLILLFLFAVINAETVINAVTVTSSKTPSFKTYTSCALPAPKPSCNTNPPNYIATTSTLFGNCWLRQYRCAKAPAGGPTRPPTSKTMSFTGKTINLKTTSKTVSETISAKTIPTAPTTTIPITLYSTRTTTPKSTTETASETIKSTKTTTSFKTIKTYTGTYAFCTKQVNAIPRTCSTSPPNYIATTSTLFIGTDGVPCWQYQYRCAKAPAGGPTRPPTSKTISSKTIASRTTSETVSETISTKTTPKSTTETASETIKSTTKTISSKTIETYEDCKTQPRNIMTCNLTPPNYVTKVSSLVQKSTEPPCWEYRYKCTKAPMPTFTSTRTKTIPKSTTETVSGTISTKTTSKTTTIPNGTIKNCTFTTKTVPVVPTCSAGYTGTYVTKTLSQQGELCISTTFKCQAVSTKCIPTTISVTKTEKETITVKETVTVTVTATETEPSQNCASKWAQCGGQGFNGPTCCQSGSTCIKLNDYYSQCI
jgi:hypothetical protein